MEDNRKFELDDELLDDVAGGAGGSGGAAFQVGDRVKQISSCQCPSCSHNWNGKEAQVHKQLDPSYNVNPLGTIVDLGSHRGCEMATVRFDCCNGEAWIAMDYLVSNFTHA